MDVITKLRENALFVVLKRGIRFDPSRGSYPVSAAESPDTIFKTLARSSESHRRILGVFDAMSGEPLDSCAVTDSATGTTALTTRTGTISLQFLAAGANTLRIAKTGYATATVHVDIAPGDSVPVTVVLWPSQPNRR